MSKIRHILLIEDNLDLRDELNEILVFEGYSVQVAEDGREGLDKLNAARPDLVICDYDMPEVNGGEVLRTIRSNPQNDHIPFILMSGSERPKNLDGLEHKFISKPMVLNTLLLLIEGYASNRE